MTESYKLCPKCKNPLDLKEIYCPYCWESFWINFSWNQIKQDKWKNTEIKKVSRLARFMIILFVIPIITSIISFIIWLISEIFDSLL